MKTELKDKWVLITGASSGFGAAAARAFGAEGARLLLGARRVDRLEEVAAQTRKAGAAGKAHAQALDVGQTPSVETFFKWVRAKTGRLDVLINNAGGAHGVGHGSRGKDADCREAMVQSNLWACCA